MTLGVGLKLISCSFQQSFKEFYSPENLMWIYPLLKKIHTYKKKIIIKNQLMGPGGRASIDQSHSLLFILHSPKYVVENSQKLVHSVRLFIFVSLVLLFSWLT